MPQILSQNGFRFYVYPNDHIPAHVHVIRAGGEVVINLGNEHTAPEIREIRGMTGRDAIRALRICAESQTEFLRRWREIHG